MSTSHNLDEGVNADGTPVAWAPPLTVGQTAVESGLVRATILSTSHRERKETPIYSGVIKYFPDALAYVAQISFAGNKKHNPGEPLHWAREKSSDHLDCAARHLVETGTVDPDDGFLHDGKLVWRALANLQEVLEKRKREGKS